MDKLKTIILQHRRWQPISDYIDRIETYSKTDFSACVENSKSLLETIAKEICDLKGVEVSNRISINELLKKAFVALGYSREDLVTQISCALETIAQQIGQLRNQIGVISHGKTLEMIRDRNSSVDEFTKEFLLDTTVIIASFLIQNFELSNPRISSDNIPSYLENIDFNEYWDEIYGEFSMGEMSYTASEILYNMDIQAYRTELMLFQDQEEDE